MSESRAFEVRYERCVDPACPITLHPMTWAALGHMHFAPDQPGTCARCLGWGTTTEHGIPRGPVRCSECEGRGWVESENAFQMFRSFV